MCLGPKDTSCFDVKLCINRIEVEASFFKDDTKAVVLSSMFP